MTRLVLVPPGAQIPGVGWVPHAWTEAGMPVVPWRRAPAGLATRRQLRALRLCPGGQPPVAILARFPGSRLWAWLYRLDLAQPAREATPAVRAALAEAMRARRTCPTCGRDTGCCIPRSLGECWDCHITAPTRLAATAGTDTTAGRAPAA